MTSQWIAFAVAVLIIGGLLVCASCAHGVKIKPEPHNKPPERSRAGSRQLLTSAWHVSAPSMTST